MSSRFHASALVLALALAGPAIAEEPRHPAASIDVSALTVESDFTVFMAMDVPEDVRLAGLRRLWTLMKLPVSCHDLCDESAPAASDFVQVAQSPVK